MQDNCQSENEQETPTIAVPNADIKSGVRQHGYNFISYIGRGAQAETWLVSDKDGKPFAVKVYDMKMMQDWKEEMLLRREVAVLQQLDINGVPKYYDFIEALPKFYLVMEYISAPTLQTRIDSGQRPTIADAGKLLFSLAGVLAEIHSKLPPIIHRDIKPSNIMVDDDYNAWIVDFGVVASQEQQTFGSTVAGSVGYMAPELLMGRATAAVDIYSLGATMLHFITGKAPYAMGGDGLDIDYAPYLPNSLPVKFREVLDDMLASSPKNRIANGQELLERLNGPHRIEVAPQKVKKTSVYFGFFFMIAIMLINYIVFLPMPEKLLPIFALGPIVYFFYKKMF